METSTQTNKSCADRRLDYVRFDVGHYLYLSHRSTIMKFPDSVIAKFIAPEFDTRKSQLDYIVIDRDGRLFGSILNFMRDKSSLMLDHWSDNDLIDLMREADFYCLGELVEMCEAHFVAKEKRYRAMQEMKELKESYQAPSSHRLEIIFGKHVMRELLKLARRPTIVISYQTMRRYNIDSWIEELVRHCDHSRFRMYCFSARHDEASSNDQDERALHDFILSLYDPSEKRFFITVPAPSIDKFRTRRAHYKCKVFKYWMMIQSDFRSVSVEPPSGAGAASGMDD